MAKERIVKAIFSLAVMCFVCGGLTADDGAGVERLSIRLGLVAPLTGDFGNYGAQIQAGVELAVDALARELPEAKIQVYYEDACLPAPAVTAAKKLVEVNRIHAVVGSYCVVGMAAMGPFLNEQRIIAFHTSPVADSILRGRPYIMTTNVSVGTEAAKAADYAFTVRGARTAAAMFVTTQWGQEYSDGFRSRFEELGGKFTFALDTPIGNNDFRAELMKLKAANPDIIFLAHVGGMLGNLLKQAVQLGLRGRFVGVDEAEEESVLQIAGSAAEGLTFFAPIPEEENDRMRKFKETYRSRIGSLPGSLAANAYDATTIAVRALASCSLSPECARDSIRKVPRHSGVSGEFTITEQGGTVREFVRKEVRNGMFKRAQDGA